MNRFLLLFLLLLCAASSAHSQKPAHTFTLGGNDFLLDGTSFRIVAGEMHYARIPREYWRQRLRMARAMGINTVATYVFWNYHEPRPGKFDFATENRNIAAFIGMAGEEGLRVIVRPGPYACAEWEFGGYPWWLLKEKDMLVRSRDPRFLRACERYLNRLGREIAPLQITRGGPVILVQVENEYGSFGSDREYMEKIRDMIRASGIDVPLTTADGTVQMKDGAIPGALPALDGEYDPATIRDTVRKYHGGKGPFFVSEFYPGWLDNWGLKHSVVPAEEIERDLDTLLRHGISVSLYVVHGGTNFGFMNGANYSRENPIQPQPTSYDYDAPIDEAGRATPKYRLVRELIRRHLPAGDSLPEPPPENPVIEIPPIPLLERAGLAVLLPKPRMFGHPPAMEELDQGYGWVLYRTTLRRGGVGVLKIGGLRDYAVVRIDGKRAAVLDRRLGQDSARIEIPATGCTLEILVENLGRINYGRLMTDNRKGILGDVTFEGAPLAGWSVYPLPFEILRGIRYGLEISAGAPTLRRGVFTLDTTGDTFLDMCGWGKGCVWVNGHNLGRYWNIGPQQTLYLPGVWLKRGKNEIVVFELLYDTVKEIRGVATPVLDLLRTQAVRAEGTFDREGRRMELRLTCDDPGASIRYTEDGTQPDPSSKIYTAPLFLAKPATITARAFREDIATAPPAVASVLPSLSTGRRIVLKNPFSTRYAAGGEGALADGFTGTENFRDGHWQGFEGVDLAAVVDLEQERPVSGVRVDFLQDIDSWIFLPASVEIATSLDGTTFTLVRTIASDAPLSRSGAFVKSFSAPANRPARYIRVTAKNIGVCPPGHKGAGKKAWIFADEIVVDQP